MRPIIIIALLGSSGGVCAEGKAYSLDPVFLGVEKVEFVSVDYENRKFIKGSLTSKNGQRYGIPDECEPEGGDAELSDAYTVKGKNTYLLFTCAWPVQHSGIGLNGIQYETFVYAGKNLTSIVKKETLSQSLSGYEGSLEGGGNSYAWYVPRTIASKKILELESGKSTDSLVIAHEIILIRLNNGDYEAIKFYLSPERIKQLFLSFPARKSTVAIYNDLGYALGQSGEYALAYDILSAVEKISPDRAVLKLNIADVLWASDQEKSKAYYREYIGLMKKAGKAKLIPVGALERGAFE